MSDTSTIQHVPDASFAMRAASRLLGQVPISCVRFENALCNYVFEVTFSGGWAIVLRATTADKRAVVESALYLSGLLRPLGVPLPSVIAHDCECECPFLILEKLPGVDLGRIMERLSSPNIERIAARVADAQLRTADVASSGRFGYATRPREAPYSRWSDVVVSNFRRSEKRVRAAGLFVSRGFSCLGGLVLRYSADLDLIEPTAFLHDTTCKNVMVAENGEFSGIVDVDEICFGDPRFPVALTSAALHAYGGPLYYVDSWMGHAGFKRDALFNLYILLFLFEFIGEHGHSGEYLYSGASDQQERGRLLSIFESLFKQLFPRDFSAVG